MATPVKFEERVKLALKLGWTITEEEWKGERYYDLVPPKHFACRDWAGIMGTEKYHGKEVSVPHYFWDDGVLYTGTRF